MSEKRNLIPMKAALERGHFKRTKAYKLIDAGAILAYKMGHKTMIDADSIDAYHASLPPIEPGSGGAKAAKERALASAGA
jgi:hypothetical protein